MENICRPSECIPKLPFIYSVDSLIPGLLKKQIVQFNVQTGYFWMLLWKIQPISSWIIKLQLKLLSLFSFFAFSEVDIWPRRMSVSCYGLGCKIWLQNRWFNLDVLWLFWLLNNLSFNAEIDWFIGNWHKAHCVAFLLI